MRPERSRTLRVPSIVHHRPSDQSVVFLRQPDGRRQMVYLGQHGSAAARRRYPEVLAEHLGPPTKQTRDRDTRAAEAPLCREFFDVATYRRAIHRACDEGRRRTVVTAPPAAHGWHPHRH